MSITRKKVTKIPPGWQPPPEAEQRPPRMDLSDRLHFWLITVGGLALMAFGVFLMWLLRFTSVGGVFVGLGFFLFAFCGSPSQASRNGYRE